MCVEFVFPASRELARVVFMAGGEHGLLDVPDDQCDLVVFLYRSFDDEYVRVNAEAVETTSGSSDGWYGFLEGFHSLAWLIDDLNESPGGVTWEIDCLGHGEWVFDSPEHAMFWVCKYVREHLGVQRKYTAIRRH